MATPLALEAAEIDKAPEAEKLAVPAPPRAVFRSFRKLPDEKGVPAPPLPLMVPAVKSMSTRCCTTPALLTTATVVLPVKPPMALVKSRHVALLVWFLGVCFELAAMCVVF